MLKKQKLDDWASAEHTILEKTLPEAKETNELFMLQLNRRVQKNSVPKRSTHTGHRMRLRNRFLREGLTHFEQHEILELLLYYSIPRRDTNPIAHDLLEHFGSLAGVLQADVRELVKVKGITENAGIFLSLISHVQAYYAINKHGEKPLLDSSSKAGNFAISLFENKKYETFYVICLDNQNRVNRYETLSEGTINETAIYPRNLVEMVLRNNANSVIISHNHPGASLKPSTADINATRNIKAALDTIQIKLIDHIIVGGKDYFSFAEKGLL